MAQLIKINKNVHKIIAAGDLNIIYGYKQRSIEQKYSKEFKKAYRDLGFEGIHFHHLRNS